MNGIVFTDNFVPEGGKHSAGSAVTVGPGVLQKELYTAAAAKGLIFVGGLSRSICIAGGYTQGGGHSFLSPWKGMASDNVLEFEVVTASGDIIVANDYQNSDLFWVLRGGGAGTFGVVTRATIKTHPDPPMVGGTLNISTFASNSEGFWAAITELHSQLPTLSDHGCSLECIIAPNTLLPGGEAISVVSPSLWFVDQTNLNAVNGFLEPLLSVIREIENMTVSYNMTFLPKTSTMYEQALPGNDEGMGITLAEGSRLISRDFLLSAEGPRKLTDLFARLPPALHVYSLMVGGGQLALNRKEINSALNPIWGDALLHVVYLYSWPSNTTVEEQRDIWRHLTDVDLPPLQSLEPDMGAYTNEADAYEVDFQKSFWGVNYARLYELKQKWDPSGLFIVRRGVGSEDWDDEGLCRKR